MVTEHQKNVARSRGLSNVNEVVEAAQVADVPFHVACALFKRESSGRNVYGRSDGSDATLSGFPGAPNEANFAAFWWMVNVQRFTSNGVGPGQVTSRGLLQAMLDNGKKPWNVLDNMTFSLNHIRNLHRENDGSWFKAYLAYNGSESNAAEFVEQIKDWKEWLS